MTVDPSFLALAIALIGSALFLFSIHSSMRSESGIRWRVLFVISMGLLVVSAAVSLSVIYSG